MKKISLLDLSSSIHGGENFAFTEFNVFGYHMPYLNGKAFKKVSEKFFDTTLVTASGLYGLKLMTDKSKADSSMTAIQFMGSALAIALLKGASEDFLIDPIYDYCGMDKG